ncbi:MULTISPECIES: type A2 lanthipeptide [Streptococcaceae]|uniref:Lantibiotic macedovicin n=4 Tax=Streptococcus TaxID=1301 RepID=LANA_STRMD|nr:MULTISPECIES: type A2 lanthipeptide [Streptococcaceae]H2A7G5.1 RecName: Full=Lantibiotic macedovicin; Flags: Precursor [Streptococcus macedonicus ACA-DC 198]AAP23217.1 bovicin HJ50 [Streptococcus equinus]MCO4478807.1 hypothetical protein [Streptococcus infantarius subsp. infantarius]BAF75720.1 thermophilin 1277 [Streptococcus thermophilus]ACA51934.1 BovA [Streptococcus equinus]EWM62233.1 Columbicin A-like bacteriocin peptide [Streptococcus thermophilus TH1477]
MMNATENQIFVETVSDQELEMLIGGADRGWIKTLTKDCPNVISSICAGTIITACKNCA